MAKVKALYEYVSRNIRYVSLSFGLGRMQPHAASEVLANGYGDCKDKNTLLAALLDAEGIPLDFVLIGSKLKLDPDIPAPSQFDHVITRVPVDGKEIWLDSTPGVAPFRMLSWRTCATSKHWPFRPRAPPSWCGRRRTCPLPLSIEPAWWGASATPAS
jgi:hypothetical protein